MCPVVRLFIALSNGVPGTAADQYRFGDMATIVRPKAGDRYPLLHPEFCFYALLTDGRGSHQVSVLQRFGVGPAGEVVWQSGSATIDLGADPLALRGFPIRLKAVEFRHPGQYEFVLICDGVENSSLFIEARV